MSISINQRFSPFEMHCENLQLVLIDVGETGPKFTLISGNLVNCGCLVIDMKTRVSLTSPVNLNSGRRIFMH